MKARSVGVEFDISLSEEEIVLLGRETLRGRIKMRDCEGLIGEKSFYLKIDETPGCSPYADIRFLPRDAGYPEWKGFVFIVSTEGYRALQKHGSCGDRIGFNGGCRLNVYSEERRGY